MHTAASAGIRSQERRHALASRLGQLEAEVLVRAPELVDGIPNRVLEVRIKKLAGLVSMPLARLDGALQRHGPDVHDVAPAK